MLLLTSARGRYFTKQLLALVLLGSVLTACGDGASDSAPSSPDPVQPQPPGDNSPAPVPNPDPTPPTDPDTPIPPPAEPTNPSSKVAFNFQQRSANQPHQANQVQSLAFSNASGQFKYPIANEPMTGNLTISIDVSDSDGISGVFVGFSGASEAIQLCPPNCNNDFHSTITGVNPLDFGVVSGPVRLELMVDDLQGNRTLVNTVDFTWQAKSITGLNISRSPANIELSWDALGNYLRYNVYIASQAGVTHKNYQTLSDGQAFLALRSPNLPVTGREDAKVFFTAVTGIDGSGESAFSDTLKIAGLDSAPDLPPVATNDSFSVNEDTQLNDSLTANDFDEESGSVNINTNPLTSPSNGQLSINGDGTFSYLPTDNFAGRDMFSYQVTDGIGQIASATVTITVNATNDAPESSYNNFNVVDAAVKASAPGSPILAVSQSALAGTLLVAAPGLLINDIDIDSSNITVVTTPLVPPTQGTVILNADGSFVYTSNDGASGTDQFTYQTSDGQGGLADAIVRITINGDSFPPIAANDRYTLEQDQTFVANNSSSSSLSILANDLDLDPNDVLTISTNFILDPQHGNVNLAPDGTFTYTPNSGFFGTDFLVYEITDLQGNTAQAGLIFTITRKNTAPVTQPDAYTFDEDTTLSVSAASGVLNNDSDLEDDPISVNVNVLLSPTQGQLTMASNGSFSYVPDTNFAGTDSFQYQVVDSLNLASVETVSLTITSINDIPIAVDDFAQTFTNTAVTIDVTANDTDADGDALNVTTATATNGTVTTATNNILTFTPDTGFEGFAQIDYVIADPAGALASATVSVSVNNINDAPVAVNDSYTINEDVLLNVNGSNQPTLLANDTDNNGDALTVDTAAFVDVTNGTLTLSADGTFTYQANLNFFGSDSFRYQINDGQGGTAVADVSLTITSVNDDPTAVDDTQTATEETLVNIDVLINDSDIENDTFTITAATAQHGLVTFATGTSINYTPDLDFFGTDTIDYTITDANQGTASAMVAVTVQNTNDAPVANNDSAVTNEDSSVIIDVLNNDTDIDRDTLEVLSATANNGLANINADQTVTYTPNNNFTGFDTLNYTISDQNGGNASAFVSITINIFNQAPVANPDSVTTDEDTLINIKVLSNDTDDDNDSLSVTSATATNGAVTVQPDNSLNYRPDSDFNGSDTVAYNIEDGRGGTASSTVAVSVIAVNDNPVAVADIASTSEDMSVNINVLANDLDIDSTSITLLNGTANNGSVFVLANQTLNYQPNENFNGTDFITYVIADDNGGSGSGSVTVNVGAVNDLPLAVDDIANTDEELTVTINVLSNDTDIDGDSLTVSAATANNGSVSVNADQTLSYTPNDQFNGQDTINYTADDLNGGTASAIVTVTVAPVNDQPIAVNDIASTSEEIAVNIDVLSNDTDVDNDALTVTNPTAINGTVIVASNQTLDYTPNLNFNGTDIINYSLDDHNGGTASAQVTVSVSPVNDNPVATDDTATTVEDSPTPISINVLSNDVDIDGDTLAVTGAVAANGAVILQSQNRVEYTPGPDFNGQDTIDYTIEDGQGGTATAKVLVEVTGVNDTPVAVNDSFSSPEDSPATLNVLANDTDIDGDSLTVSNATLPAGTGFGSLLINADFTLNYQPEANFNGTLSINYDVSDGLSSTSAIATVTITAINDAPTAVADSLTINEDSATFIDVLANDIDPDLITNADVLSVINPTATNGSVSVETDQSILYTPTTDFSGVDVINYTVQDSAGLTSSTTVDVTISPVNDLPVAVNDSATVNEDTLINLDVLLNDSDIDGDQLSIDNTPLTAINGVVTIEPDNTLNYTPNTHYFGADTISYQISDGKGGIASAIVNLNVVNINDAPIALSDSEVTLEDTSVSISVLTNDSDIEGDTLTLVAANSAHGSTSIIGGATIDFTPDADFNGLAIIDYTIDDNGVPVESASSTVSVNVSAVNDAPVAGPDNINAVEDTPINIDPLDNDTDVDNDALTITSATVVDNGAGSASVAIARDGSSIDYTPAADFSGTDIITYFITDGSLNDSATITVNISAVNDNPIALNDTAFTDEDMPITSINVLTNDSDPEGALLNITSPTALNGSASVISGPAIDYTPNPDFFGTDTITYHINDGSGGTATGEVTVTVNAINDNPVALPDNVTVVEDTPTNIAVLTNDSDIEGNALTVDTPIAGNGTVTVNSGTTLDYTPASNFYGSDIISYQISDGQGGSAASQVNVTVSGVDDAPIAVMDTVSVDEDILLNIDVLANDSEPDNQTLILSGAPTAINGVLTVKSDKTLDYVPNVNFNGADTITYHISDGTSVVTGTVDVTVNPINDPPVINDVTTSIAENTANNTPVTRITGSDVDTGQSLTYSIVTNSANIFAINTNSGELSISDNTNLNFETSMQHVVTVQAKDDGPGAFIDTATITVNVTNVLELATPTLDNAFGLNGTAASNSFSTERFDMPGGAVIDAAGKLVVVSKNEYTSPAADISIVRFNADGTLDRTFGILGIVNKDLTQEEQAVAVAIDGSGNIVVAGTQINGPSPFVFVARFTSAGVLDSTFNSADTPGFNVYAESSEMIAADMKIHSSGAIIVAASDPAGGGFRLVKFSADGTTHSDIPASFFGGSDKASAVNFQSDGKALISGTVDNLSNSQGYDFGVARFDVSSTPFLDTGYANSGTAIFDFGNSTDDISLDAFMTAADELIMAGSTVSPPSTVSDFAALKIDSSGALITGFGSSGFVKEDLDGDNNAGTNLSLAKSVTADSNGNLYFAINKGSSEFSNIVYKTDALGAVQAAFGTSGQVDFTHHTGVPSSINENDAIELLMDSSDRAVLLTTTVLIGEPDIVVARFTTGGVLDTEFSADGFNILDPTFSVNKLNELIELRAPPHTDKYIAVGTSLTGAGSQLIIARYNVDGSIDETFGVNGYFVLAGVEATITGKDIIELPDGRLIAVGAYDAQGLIVMVTTDGTLDPTFGTAGKKQILRADSSLSLNAVTLDKSSQIIVGGTEPNAGLYFAKMSLTGVFDISFGANGQAIIGLGDAETIEDIAILSNDAIVGVGKKGSFGLVVKLLSNGTLDSAGFAASAGYITLDLDPVASVNVDSLVRVKIKADGTIVAAGYTTDAQPANILVQLNANGSVDNTFDTDGIASLSYGSVGSKTFALALDANQRILTTGFNYNGVNDDIFVARTLATGMPDPLFNDATGGILFDYTGQEAAMAILVRADGTIVIAGSDNLNLFPTSSFFIQKIKLVEP